jgi:hypothetical protein
MAAHARAFLQLYNQLDARLRADLRLPAHVSHSEALTRRAQTDPYVREHLSELQAYRALRNAIVHMPSVATDEGAPIADPLPSVVAKYGELVGYILQPPSALDTVYAIRGEQVYSVAWQDPVLPRLAEMYTEGRDFRLAPVVVDGLLHGVFTETVLGRFWLARRTVTLDERLTFAELAPWCAEERAAGFRVVPRSATIEAVEQRFQAAFAEHWPLAVVCLTENGRLGEPLLGIVTAHDLPRTRGPGA